MAPLISVEAVDFAIIPIFNVVDPSMTDDFFEDAVHQALVEGVGMASQVVEQRVEEVVRSTINIGCDVVQPDIDRIRIVLVESPRTSWV